jgi:superfamily I DNA/RNA helicase
MQYFAITQGTAHWILGKPGVLDAIHASIILDEDLGTQLKDQELIEGAFRVSADPSGQIVALWNTDYLTGTDEEVWGVVKLSGAMGLHRRKDISREVLERAIYVIDQRLQGLLIDASFIHKAYDNGVHSCLAGGSTPARKCTLAYVQTKTETAASPVRSIICVGPEHNWTDLANFTEKESKRLKDLVAISNQLIAPARKRSVLSGHLLADLRAVLAPYGKPTSNEFSDIEVATKNGEIHLKDVYRTLALSYDDWVSKASPLTETQRNILNSDSIERKPLRIVGPGGSGKTLLMELLAIRQLRVAMERNAPLRLLYVTHNNSMAEKVKQRLEQLSPGILRNEHGRSMEVTTLSEYGRANLGLDHLTVIDADAQRSKDFQLEQVLQAMDLVLAERSDYANKSPLFSVATRDSSIKTFLARNLMAEISIAIKGHGLERDPNRYVFSETSLSRLHGEIMEDDRRLVYAIFERYHKLVFEEFNVLDSDDIAISLQGKLRTPIWQLKRKSLGFDFVFVDETQLFNENERKVFPLLSNGASAHVPVVLALDEAQDIFCQTSAGLATLGIPDVRNQSLESTHRSTRAIVKLAFYVIQRSVDLFTPDFPDFTHIADKMKPDTHPLAKAPQIETVSQESPDIGKFVVKRIRELRKDGIKQIAVICHSGAHWAALSAELRVAKLPLQILEERGTKLSLDQPFVVLSQPHFIGGQEVDAAILVGLEQGIFPPRMADNDTLTSAIEQECIREMYLSITRARYQVQVILSVGAKLTAVLQGAESAGLLTKKSRNIQRDTGRIPRQ